MKRHRWIFHLFGAVCLLGLFVGSAVPEALRMGTGSYAGFFSMYSFQKYEQTRVSPWKLFPYIASGRLQTLLFLWMSAYTSAGLWLHLFYVFWLSSSGAMLLSLFVLRDGYEGILLFFCCIFPQWLIYASVWRREFRFFLRKSLPDGYLLPPSGRQELLELAQLAGFCLFGCAVEAYLGLWTLKVFLKL